MSNKVCPKCGKALVLMPYVSKGPRRKHERHMIGESYYCPKCKKETKND